MDLHSFVHKATLTTNYVRIDHSGTQLNLAKADHSPKIVAVTLKKGKTHPKVVSSADIDGNTSLERSFFHFLN